ncbi:MAG: glycosyltransferase [Proteobacteria bacterium ST_bin11]|nr:MAG: glycosyltransferase [Proteobacteria bacterium ST_bin11]
MATSVAVIIVTWNSANLIDGVLKCLVSQTLHPARVLLIDNGSEDIDLLSQVVSRFQGYELVKLVNNTGFAKANNIGVSLCQNLDFVALLNPDAFPEPEWLERLVSAAMRHDDAAAFGSRLLDYTNPTRLDGAGDFLTIAGRPGRRGHGANANEQFTREEIIFSPCAAAALYRYSVLISVGGFDENFFCYVEDIDLGFRILLAGYSSIYVPDSVVLHIGSALTGRRSDFSAYFGHRNLSWVFLKNMPGPLLLALLPLHILLSIFTLGYCLFRRQGLLILRSKLDSIRGIPRVLQQRREIQKSRVVTIGKVWKALDKRI